MARDILTMKDKQDLTRIPKRHPEGLYCAVQLTVLNAGSGILVDQAYWAHLPPTEIHGVPS